MNGVLNFRKSDRITPRLTDQECCPECSHSFAHVDMRQVSRKLRVCCLCELKLKDKKRKQGPGRALALSAGLGFAVACYFVCMVWDPFGLSKRLSKAQPEQAAAARVAAESEVRAVQPQPVVSISALAPSTRPGASAPAMQVVTLGLPGDALFEIGRTNFKEGAETSLQRLAEVIRQNPKSKVNIRAYTDSVGTEKGNRTLSRQRAEAIRDWLVKNGGIQELRMAFEGMGSKNPVAPNAKADGTDNPVGRAQNRRVTVTLTLTSKQAVTAKR